jgi:hypothetical protein
MADWRENAAAVDAWRAAQPGDTPGELVPGEDDVTEEAAAALDERDAMRSVVEAAERCVLVWRSESGTGARLAPLRLLALAVDAWRAAQVTDPSQIEGTPERDEQEALMAMQSWDAHERAEEAPTDRLRAAALNEAADETGRLIAGPLPASQWGDGYVHGVTAAEQMLRERAGREFGVISGTKRDEEMRDLEQEYEEAALEDTDIDEETWADRHWLLIVGVGLVGIGLVIRWWLRRK